MKYERKQTGCLNKKVATSPSIKLCEISPLYRLNLQNVTFGKTISDLVICRNPLNVLNFAVGYHDTLYVSDIYSQSLLFHLYYGTNVLFSRFVVSEGDYRNSIKSKVVEHKLCQ